MKHMQTLRANTPIPPHCLHVYHHAYSSLALLAFLPFFISSSFVKGIQMQWPLCCLLSRLLCLFLLLQNLFFLIPYSAPFHKISTCPLCPLCCDCYGAEEEGECPGHRYITSFETDLFFPACC